MPVADPWYEGKKQEIVAAVYARARELRLDISENPRDLLDHPELVDVLFPGGDKFLKDKEWWEREFKDPAKAKAAEDE